MSPWPTDEIRSVPLGQLNERFRRYRLVDPGAERAVRRSLERYGQLAPIVVWQEADELVLIDGFKRLQAARTLKGFEELTARCLEVDGQSAKAAIYTLNRLSRPPQELEEAWIVHALVREDGLSQVDAGALLGRHKSWVNRRLAMWERLAEGAKEELRLGLLSPSMARQLTRLPVGNQAEALAQMQSWLRYSGRGVLQACDRGPLQPGFQRLQDELTTVREATGDFLAELKQP